MGLFYRRPLCIFCALFMLASLVFAYSEYEHGIAAFVVLIAIAMALAILFIIIKKRQVFFMFGILCVCSILLSLLFGSFRMQYRAKQAEQYIGNRNVQMSVTEVVYSSDDTSVYTVKIDEVSGNKANIKAQLVCAFGCELKPGDIVLSKADLKNISEKVLGMTASERQADDDIRLLAVLYESDGILVQKFDYSLSPWETVFRKNGLNVLITESREYVCKRLDNLLGEESSGLAKGFLLGERSEIPTEEIRDFRRTGLSHIFAVSGMHITILLGSLDYLLRKLLIHKHIRMVAVTAASLPMLAMTGFALSAWRSVIMLWFAYICFVISAETDMPTALFLSISLIILVSPYSVYDIGMWLSFFATLGLVTVYPAIEALIPYPKKGKISPILKILRSALLVLIMTVVCNTFVLPLQWYIFGEMSLVSGIANALMSPLSTAFMLCTLICVIFGSIPFLGNACVLAVQVLCDIIRNIVSALASPDFATVSLRYPFASVLILAFSIAFVILLSVKLKRKWLVGIPIASFVVLFGICVLAVNIAKPQKLTYYKDNTQEMLAISSRQYLALVDMSNGAYFRYSEALSNAAEDGAVCVDKLVFTKITKRHISSMDYFMRNNIVNTIYIPVPQNEEQRQNSLLLAALAEECGTDAYLYASGEVMELDGIEFVIDIIYEESESYTSVFVSASEKMIGYANSHIFDGENDERLSPVLDICDTLLIGSREVPDKPYLPRISATARVVYLSDELYKYSRREGESYCNTENENVVLIFSFK